MKRNHLLRTGTGPQKWISVILVLGVILANIKRIFVDFSFDVEYATAMSYRLALGDHMFSQMREPHQTSAFLLAFFIKIWLWITGTTTGIVLYLNLISLLVKLLVVLFFYCTLKRCCSPAAAFQAAAFLAIVNAKNYIILDFSNMQVYAAILLCCCLVRYLEDQRRKTWLILSAICLCLEVLSYPSSLVIYFIVVGFLLSKSHERRKDCLLFSAVCGTLGSFYIAYFGFRLGWKEFFFYIHEILTSDSSHRTSLTAKFAGYGTEIVRLFLLYGLLIAISCVIIFLLWIVCRRSVKSLKSLLIPWVITFFILLGTYDLWCIITVDYSFGYASGYFPIMLLGVCLLPYCRETEKNIFCLGACLGLGSLPAILLLTNLTWGSAMPYMLLGVAVSFIPIGRGLQSIRWNVYIPAYIFLTLILIRNVYVTTPMSFYENINIFGIANIVKSGPAMGIVSDYMGPHIINTDTQEWPQHIHSGDHVLIVSHGVVSSLPYLYEDVEICIHSTICTPTYDEKLLQYWEQNPDKLPDVVVVDCWFGQLRVDECSWIMQWIYDEFGADSFEDGTYKRYYRRGTMGYGKGTNQ